MIVRYLDLETGRKAEDCGIGQFSLTEGNWSCDCNRRIPFDGGGDSDTCEGCHRFVVVDVEAEEGDEPFEPVEVIREANSEYYRPPPRTQCDSRSVNDYPSGFRVGDRIELVEGPRKYNAQLCLRVGDTGTVDEPPNINGWPADAVQVRMDDGGSGALDSCILKKVQPETVRRKWLEVLSAQQREMRKQKRYDEINLTDDQKESLGEEGCCWIESPTFYANSQWCM